MASFGSRRGVAGGLALPLMVFAFILVGGFLAWLNQQARSQQVEVVEEVVEEDGLADATVVATAVFGANPMAQSGELIRVNSLLVQSLVGSQAFFVEMEGQSGPYLVKLGPAVVADSVVVPNGSTIAVIGFVQQMTDSVADDWVASGGIAEGDRILAIFADSFLEASDIVVAGGESGAEPQG
mgnify:CR=1 FL=1